MAGDDAAVRPRPPGWPEKQQIEPKVIANFDDTALMKAFGQAGAGVFAIARFVAPDVAEQLGLHVVGKTDDGQVQACAVTCERRIKHPAAVAISEAAKLVA